MIGKKYGIDNIDYLDIINITYILNSIEILRKLINIFHDTQSINLIVS